MFRKSVSTLLAAGLVFGVGAVASAATMTFNSTLHAGSGFSNVAAGSSHSEAGFTISRYNSTGVLGTSGLGNWGAASENFLDDPVIATASSGTYLELVADGGSEFDVDSIDVVDFFASQADGNIGNSVTFYGIKADNSIVSSVFTFATSVFDKETHTFASDFDNIVVLSWNLNAGADGDNNALVAAAHGSGGDMSLVANRHHMVDNIVLSLVPEPSSMMLVGLGLVCGLSGVVLPRKRLL